MIIADDLLGYLQSKSDLDDLENDLKEGESQTVEFKRELTDKKHLKSLADDIASFATSNSGKIYMYISAEGKPTPNNLDNNQGRDEFQLRLNGVEDNVRPAITVKLTFIKKGFCIIARIDVPKGNEPVYYSNHIPYVRDLSRSRPARPEEVKERYRIYLEQQRAPNVTVTEADREDSEEREFLIRLLFALSDAQIALSDVMDHYANPQRNQLQHDLGSSADEIHSVISKPIIKRTNLDTNVLEQIANRLIQMNSYTFYIGESYLNEFNSIGNEILQLINPMVDFIRKRLTVNEISKRDYRKMVVDAVNELLTDWKIAQAPHHRNRLEELRESFRTYGYRFNRMANLHESDEIDDIRPKLQGLARQLRKLSSVDGWGQTYIGFDRIQHLSSPMENNLEIAHEIQRVINSA